jgi:hypothetical protein
MITNFETLTEELNKEELLQVDSLIEVLKGSKRPLKTEELIREIYLKDLFKPKLKPARLRKIVNAIRSNSVAPIIATRKGYFLSQEQAEIEKQIQSLDERAFAILNASNGLKAYAVEKFGTQIFAQ